MASTAETNFDSFYNNCPNVLIRYDDNAFYVFPFSHDGGDAITQEARYTFATGRYFSNICLSTSCGQLETKLYAFNENNYTSTSNYFMGTQNDNSGSIPNGKTVTLNNQGALTGYTKLSSGTYANNNTSNYIIINRPNYNNYHFSVYKKNTELDFFNDFINLGGETKTKFLTMASNNAINGNQRYNTVPNAACSNTAMPQAGKYNCAIGAAQWCRDSSIRIWGDAASALTSTNKCYPYVQNGSLDSEVIGGCNTNLEILNNTFCKDQRVNSGSVNIKNTLAAKLATTSFCGNDMNINDPKCIDVKNACSNANNAFDNTTMPNYQCNTLIKSLNNTNKIAMLANTNIKTLPSTWTANAKTALISSFNSAASTAVSDALCNLAMNSTDPACTSYIQSNFSGLVQSSSTNPILIMYFAGDNFTVPVGMSSHNSLSISSITKANGIGIKAPTSTLGTAWCAKFYVYITPSSTDNYSFKINADDDAKLFLNNTLIIDAWGKTCCTDYTSAANINLNPTNGPYLLYVEYRDKGGNANITVSYKPSSTAATAQYTNLTNILPTTQSKYGTSPLTGLTASTLYMSSFNPYSLTTTARALQSIAFCTTNSRFATDVACLGSAANGYVAINKNYIQDNPNFNTSILNYCTTNNRFATDTTFCNNPNYKSYILNSNNTNTELNTAISTYCELSTNNTYATGTTASYCKTTDNANTNNYNNVDNTTKLMNNTYADTLRAARLKYVKSAIDASLTATGNTKGTISTDVANYITTDYPNIQTKLGKANNPNTTIIPSSLYSYCENVPDSTEPGDLCNAIYTTYNTDPNIIASAQRKLDFKLGIESNAFMGVGLQSEIIKDKYKKERDSPEKFAVYLPYAINYCATGDNIVNQECQTYYNNINGVISQGIAKQYTNASIAATPSAFTNKEPFCNGRDASSYDGENDDSKDCTDSNMLYIFLLFLFVIVLVMTLGGLSKYRKPTYCNNPHSQSYQYR